MTYGIMEKRRRPDPRLWAPKPSYGRSRPISKRSKPMQMRDISRRATSRKDRRPGERSSARLPDARHVAVEFGAAESAALEEVADRIGRRLGLRGHRLFLVVLGDAGRAIAIVVGAAVVPPRPLVERGAVEDLEAQVRILKSDADQLHEVLGADPDGEPAPIDR